MDPPPARYSIRINGHLGRVITWSDPAAAKALMGVLPLAAMEARSAIRSDHQTPVTVASKCTAAKVGINPIIGTCT